MSVMMQLPTLCGKCGEHPPTTRYTVQERKSSFSPWTLLTMFIGMRVRRNQTVQYDVPLCAECQAKVSSQKRTGLIVMIVGILIAVGGIVWLITGYNALASVQLGADYAIQYQSLLPTLLPIALGFFIAWIGSMIGTPRFASWNSKGFRFKNKAYHEAFAELNPNMVK